jgi:biopolymer transport protein ExbD
VPVKFRCSECTQKLRIEDAYAGKLVACVRCGSKQRVPLETSPEFAEAQPPAKAPKQSQPSDPPAPKKPPFKPRFIPPPKEAIPEQPRSHVATPEQPPARESAKPFKPWQPRPVREEPLPSEKPQQSTKLPSEEPAREIPLREKRQPETPPGELSNEALSAIFDEPIRPSAVELQDEWREEDKPATAQEFHGIEFRAEEAEGDFDDGAEAADDLSPEFEAVPLIVAGTAPVEADLVPARFDAPQAARLPQPAPAGAHAEPSMVPPAKKLDVEEMIDMTAMVDIVFFLLIFFLVTSMHSLDSTIPMPAPDPQKGTVKEPQTVAAIDADDSYIVVRIDKNDKITVEGAEVRNERELLFKLHELRVAASRPEKLLVIGHGDSTHGTAVMILDAGRELGMEHVKLTVQDEEE